MEDESLTITDDVQSGEGGNARCSVDKRHALETLIMPVRLDDERRCRQTTDDIKRAQTFGSRHRHIPAERKLLHTAATLQHCS